MTTATPPAPSANSLEALGNQATDYARAVIAGEVLTGRLVRLAAERHMRDLETGAARGIHYDAERAGKAIKFFGYLKHSKGEWAGRPFKIRPWQMFIVGNLFGWVKEYGQCGDCESWSVLDHATRLIRCSNPECEPDPQAPAAVEWLRRFRLAYNEIPRKNGKSFLAAGVGLLLAFFDGEGGAEVYAAATKRDQAKIVWGDARAMVLASPPLKQRINVLVGNLNNESTRSKFEPLGADSDGMDGLNVHGRIIDELHAHKTRAMWDVLETATGARRQPLGFVITTAGYDRFSVCYEQHDYGIKILERTVEDDTFFAYIATCDEGDDWTDPQTWIKANPNYGVSVKPDDLERKCRKAQSVPAEQNSFLRLHLNVWTEQATRWLDMDVWHQNAGDLTHDELRAALAGRLCVAGLDLSQRLDLTAIELVFEADDDGVVPVLSFPFVPEENIRKRVDRDRVPYDAWIRDGFLEATPGNVIDYEHIVSKVEQLAAEFEIKEVAYDPWNAMQTATQLQGLGFTCVPITQGFRSLTEPTKEVENLLVEKKLQHADHPVLTWAASNVALSRDAAGNVKPDKSKSTERIDPMTALITAMARLIVIPETTPSAYESHGLEWLA